MHSIQGWQIDRAGRQYGSGGDSPERFCPTDPDDLSRNRLRVSRRQKLCHRSHFVHFGRLFNRTKHFRRIASRREKHAVDFHAFVKLAAIGAWLRV
jgi:transposase